MTYTVTSRSERLVRDLLRVAAEVDDDVLARASVEARAEWSALVDRLPTEPDLRRGVIPLPEDELGWMLDKARRFREILSVVAPRPRARLRPSA